MLKTLPKELQIAFLPEILMYEWTRNNQATYTQFPKKKIIIINIATFVDTKVT